jgi:hypothetical protein
MSNSINTLSPNFRDILLNRNIISNIITDNGLSGLLNGIGYPTQIENIPTTVRQGNSISNTNSIFRNSNTKNNSVQANTTSYRNISINYIPSPVIRNRNENTFYSQISDDSPVYKDLNVIQNQFQGDDDDYRKVTINYIPKDGSVTYSPYLDERGNLNVGGPSTQPFDILGSVLQGGGIGFNPNGGNLVPDYDVRSSLSGRILNSVGIINDTKLGQLSGKYLLTAIGNNVAFNIQDNTIGKVNLNPLSLINGNDFIIPNYKITVAKGNTGIAVDLLERMSGFKTPVSLLSEDSSIFTFNSKNYIPSPNISRANSMIANTGKGQVLALFNNINSNLNPNLIGRRNGYAPGYSDSRVSKGQNTSDGINPNLYAFDDGFGGVIDLLNSNISVDFNNDNSSTKDEFDPNTPISQSAYRLEGLINNSGFNESPNDFNGKGDDGGNVKQYIWGDTTNANAPGKRIFGDIDFNRKTLLGRTKKLFDSNKMRTIVSGKAVGAMNSTEINSVIRNSGGAAGFMSKASGVLSEKALRSNSALDDSESVFCRVWTTFDRYDQIQDLQKKRGLDELGRKSGNPDSVKNSVLEDFGFVKIGPYVDDDHVNGVKKFMFSIENLAWADDIDKLIPCEIGNGDPISGTKGRIMWFPPYDITFNESTSVNWDKSNFIGRGEPIYTYNNSERTGTLSWKIIIDHPNYVNFLRKEPGVTNDEIASFFAGCLEMKNIREDLLTAEENRDIEVDEAPVIIEEPEPEPPKEVKFSVYFPNDSASIIEYKVGEFSFSYEDGKYKDERYIDYDVDPEGNGKNQTKGIIGGLGTITPEKAYVSTKLQPWPDKTDFGLNVKPVLIGDKEVRRGLRDSDFIPSLTNYLTKECKYCKIKITAYASQQGIKSDKETKEKRNLTLSKARAESIESWFKANIQLEGTETPLLEERIISTIGEGQLINNGCLPRGVKGGPSPVDSKPCKEDRRADVIIYYDKTLEPVKPIPQPKKIKKRETKKTTSIPISRFFTECDYFERLKRDDRFIYDEISQKLKHFHPSFHSITPEGFNSRLTFLQQCTRQGSMKKIVEKYDGANEIPENLAFGRPPVCILRIGDFYHTKIIIDNLSIDYDPLVWDLNPEGVGVQPMIANITISFSFIGGSSLNGPLSRLQNAISFNFFGNTEIYDPRADRIQLKKNENKVISGIFPNELVIETNITQSDIPLNENDKNQEDALINENSKSENTSSENNEEDLKEKGLRISKSNFTYDFNSTNIIQRGTLEFTIITNEELKNESYNIEISIYDEQTNEIKQKEVVTYTKGILSKDYSFFLGFTPEKTINKIDNTVIDINFRYGIRAKVTENNYIFSFSLSESLNKVVKVF